MTGHATAVGQPDIEADECIANSSHVKQLAGAPEVTANEPATVFGCGLSADELFGEVESGLKLTVADRAVDAPAQLRRQRGGASLVLRHERLHPRS